MEFFIELKLVFTHVIQFIFVHIWIRRAAQRAFSTAASPPDAANVGGRCLSATEIRGKADEILNQAQKNICGFFLTIH